jgi:hypothetical protein
MKALALALLLVAACGPKSKPAASATTAPTEDTSAPAKDCADYEHETELCRPSCEDCAGATPGNACNECAEACASKVFCDECNDAEYCEE